MRTFGSVILSGVTAFVLFSPALLLPSARGEWVLLDNFNDDAAATLDGQASSQGTWDTDGELTGRAIVTADGTNQMLTWRANDSSSTGDREFAGPLGDLSIPNSSAAATLYLRFRHNGDGGYQRFGLWDQGGSDASLAGANSINLQFILLDDTAAATNKFRLVSRGPSGPIAVGANLDVGVWYSMWVVIDQSSDIFDVHLKGGAYAERTLLLDNTPFRSNTVSTLNGFAGQGYRSAAFTVTSDLDDIYIDLDGENLTEPESPEPPQPKHYDVYLVGGQSNADGRGYNNQLTGSLSPYAAEQTDVRIFFANPANSDPVNPTYRTGWVPLKPGWSVPPGFSGSLPSDRFGFEVSFGRALADRHPDRNIALLKVTRGGTSLSADWDPFGGANYMWQTFTNQVPAALAALAAGGNTCTVRGMIWHQGESDGSNPTFEADLAQFIASVRGFLGLPQLPFAIGELERDDVTPTVTGRTYQLQAMAAVAAADPFSGVVSSAGFMTVDGTHFDTPSVIDFGIRYADAIGDIDADGLPDEWEAGYFGSITNSAGATGDDRDADGFPDLGEYHAGTDPTSAVSRLELRDLRPPVPGGIAISWSSATGKTYRVQRGASLVPAAWTNLQDAVPATPPLNTYTDAAPEAASGFYRVNINIAP